MKLHMMKEGQSARIVDISDNNMRIEALRFGIGVGQSVECVTVIPYGPVIVRKSHQQLAIGRDLAATIEVRVS